VERSIDGGRRGLRLPLRDQLDATYVNILFGADDSAMCLMEAPNAEAVVKAHRRNGVPLTRDRVTEVTTLI